MKASSSGTQEGTGSSSVLFRLGWKHVEIRCGGREAAAAAAFLLLLAGCAGGAAGVVYLCDMERIVGGFVVLWAALTFVVLMTCGLVAISRWRR